MKTKWKQIGSCAVDSGTVILVDPCYVLPDKVGEVVTDKDYTYEKFGNESFVNGKDQLPKEITFSGIGGIGVAIGGFGGDGCYPVYIKEKNGYVSEVKIIFNY